MVHNSGNVYDFRTVFTLCLKQLVVNVFKNLLLIHTSNYLHLHIFFRTAVDKLHKYLFYLVYKNFPLLKVLCKFVSFTSEQNYILITNK